MSQGTDRGTASPRWSTARRLEAAINRPDINSPLTPPQNGRGLTVPGFQDGADNLPAQKAEVIREQTRVRRVVGEHKRSRVGMNRRQKQIL